MATRKRRKYTWFPTNGTDGPGESSDDFAFIGGQLTINPAGGTAISIQPMLPDVPSEEPNPNEPGALVKAIGSEYVIERIVGKAFIGATGAQDDGEGAVFPKQLYVGLGIFVARAADNDAGGGPNLPIGAASQAEQIENYSPLGTESIREPWMFRRTWVLSTGRADTNVNAPAGPFAVGVNQLPAAPRTTMGYGSVHDGPHVDVKSVRRVRQDDRLWAVVAARSIDDLFIPGASPNQTLAEGVAYIFDYRVLGQLRRARNTGSF